MGAAKIVTRTIGLTAAAGVALLGVEAYLVATKKYLRAESAVPVGGRFGRDADPPLAFGVVGDSTSAGVGAGAPGFAYPTFLAERLAATGLRVDLHCFGVVGAVVADALADQVPRAEAAKLDLILVLVGAIDVIKLTPLTRFQRGYSEILDRLTATGATVVVSGLPDMRARSFLEPLRRIAGARGRHLSRVVEAEATTRGLAFAPLADLTGGYFADPPDGAYSSDDFHPGPAGYEAWADAIFPTLDAALAARQISQSG